MQLGREGTHQGTYGSPRGESNSSPYLPHILAEYEVVSFGFLFTERYGDGVEPTSNRFLVLITGHGCKG